MPSRRILSLWFPRLSVERTIRANPQFACQPLAIVAERRGALVLSCLSLQAEALGPRPGMTLGDARAIAPGLVTRAEDPHGDAAFLAALRRWAGRFSPWVAEEGRQGLVLDITGCAHLFGGEAGLAEEVAGSAADLGLSLEFGLADSLGAAWAVARFAETATGPLHAGDAIDQEARATRSRARKRRWEHGGAPPPALGAAPGVPRILPPGETHVHIAALPVAALRIDDEEVRMLEALGLRRIGDIARLPRAQLSRRVGTGILRRLDQALGRVPEPVSPARPAPVLALRLTFPEPIALESDILAGIDRLLGPLCARLGRAGQGARRVRLALIRVDGSTDVREVGLALPSDRPEAIRHLLALKLADVDAGFGIEVLRLEASAVEPLSPRQHRGQLAVTAAVRQRQDSPDDGEGLTDLLGRIGARLGIDALTRLHPAESHIPEKTATVMAAAFSEPARSWPAPPGPRPILLFPPEPVTPGDDVTPPLSFTWRRRALRRGVAFGPERIAPEWWLDDPAWRSGARDYWRIETTEGTRLWLFETRGSEPRGWFAQGIFG